jgi:hypothetical protein
VAEGLSASEVGKEIAHHKEHSGEGGHGHAGGDDAGGDPHATRHRLLSIGEAVLLSIVALMAAWSGYSAAKWGTDSSLSLAKASAIRATANLDSLEATQIRTLDSVSFNAALSAYETHNKKLFKLTLKRLRPGYKPAVTAWLALHPLKNPDAPPDPSYMPQYKIPQQTAAAALNEQATEKSNEGQHAASIADKYVRLTVFLAAILFLVGISSHFPVLGGRYALIGLAAVLLIVSIVQLLGLPGPPA